jgi:uncharacterized membrane protein YfcA
LPIGLQIALTVALGVVSGVLSGMFGIGGAVITTPGIRALGATAFEAIGSTLPSILPSSISGSLRYNREKFIRGRIVLIASAFGIPASVIGSRLSRSVPGDGHWLMIATALLIGFTAYRTAYPTVRADGTTGALDVLRDEWWMLAIIGIAAGALSGLLGIGGGILMVPAFSAWVGLPLKETIATSLACVGIFAIPGTITHAIQDDIDWTYAIALAAGVIPGARIGAHFTIAANDKTLRYTVASALTVIALIYAVGEVNALL